MTVDGEPGGFTAKLEALHLEPGLALVRLHLTAAQPARLQLLTLRFKLPSVDISGSWNSNEGLDKVNHFSNATTSGASGAAPLIALHNNQLVNLPTCPASHALNPIEMCYSTRATPRCASA